MNPKNFILLPFLFAGTVTVAMTNQIISTTSTEAVVSSTVWLLIYFIVSIGFGYILTVLIHYVLSFPYLLPQKNTLSDFRIPTGILFFVKNEGEVIKKMLARALENSSNSDVHLVSNSDDLDKIKFEKEVVASLNKKFGKRCFHVQVNPPKHKGFEQWLSMYADKYKYCFLCDADSSFDKGVIQKLIAKAEHPDNQKFAVFQTQLHCTDDETIYSNALSFGQEVAQRLYNITHWRVFRESVFFGSGSLVRTKAVKELDVPANALSHDIWDTAYLNKRGWIVAFCEDVTTFEMFPTNFLETIKREIRWAKGTLQSWSLLKLSGLSLATRFYIALPIYLYIMQCFFLLWLIIGAFDNIFQLFEFRDGILAVAMYVFVMTVILLHRFVIVRNWQDLKRISVETFCSTLICLNGVIYSTVAFCQALTGIKAKRWKPSSKEGGRVSLKEVMKRLWLSEVIGLFFLLAYLYEPQNISLLPFVFALLFSVPIAWLSSQPVKDNNPNSVSGQL